MEKASYNLTSVANDLLSEVDDIANILGSEYYKNEGNFDIDEALTHGKFTFNSLEARHIGYLTLNNILPSDLKLELSSKIQNIAIGVEIRFKLINYGKPFPTFMKNFLEHYVCDIDGKPYVINESISSDEKSIVEFGLKVSRCTQIVVKSTLFKQNVGNSPIILPVLDNIAQQLSGMRLLSRKKDDLEFESPSPTTMSSDIYTNDYSHEIESHQVGDIVVAKWSEDGCWYNAQVITVGDNVYKVMFCNFGNICWVSTTDIVKVAADGEGERTLGLLVQDQEKVIIDSSFEVGNDCLAKWKEDGRWYNAIIDSIVESGDCLEYLITFTDYGNSEVVQRKDLVVNVETLPSEELSLLDSNVEKLFTNEKILLSNEEYNSSGGTNIDNLSTRMASMGTGDAVDIASNLKDSEMLESSDKNLVEGMQIIAKKSDHSIWYRAVLHEAILPGSLYKIQYDESQKFDCVRAEQIVLAKEDIPESERFSESTILSTKPYVVGDTCVAQWSEDKIWYNAQVIAYDESNNKYSVKFVDYGNEESLPLTSIKCRPSDIPVEDLVDSNVSREDKLGGITPADLSVK